MLQRRLLRPLTWGLLGVGLIVVVVLGLWGFALYQRGSGQPTSFLTAFYLTMQLFTLESGALFGHVPWQLEIARLAAPLVAAYAVMRVAAAVFATRLREWRVRRWSAHTIVVGIDDCSRQLCLDLTARGHRVLAVAAGSAEAERLRDTGVPVLTGDPLEPQLLRKCRIDRADHLVVHTGDDGTTAQIVALAAQLVSPERAPDASRRRDQLTCVGVLSDPELWRLLTTEEMRRRARARVRVEFVDLEGAAMRALLREHPPALADEEPLRLVRQAQVLVTGTSKVAERLVIMLVRVSSAAVRLAGPDKEWLDHARRRQPELAEALVTLVDDLAHEAAPDATPIRAYVCDEDVHDAVQRTAELRALLPPGSIVVVVRRHPDRVTRLLARDAGPGGCRVVTFSLADAVCTPDVLIHGTTELLAQALHEQYLAERRASGAREDDPALVPWESLPDALRESNRDQARHISTKLWTIGRVAAPLLGPPGAPLSDADVETLSRLEHDRWMAERIRGGWHPGPRDPAARTTRYLVPWEDLSEDVRDLDRLFIRRLPETLASIGLQAIPANPIAQENH
jgi:hypothetical protein